MKNLKKTLLAFFFLSFLLTSSLLGQGWEKIYSDSSGYFQYPFIEHTDEGGFIVACNYRDSLNTTPGLIRFNEDGNIIWTRLFDSQINLPASVGAFNKIESDSTYLILINGSIFKTDFSGNIISIKPYSFPTTFNSNIFSREIHQINQDEIIILMNSKPHKRPYIIYDDNNEVIKNPLNIDTSDVKMELSSSEITFDNELILFGHSGNFFVFDTDTSDILLVKSDFYGNPTWVKQYDLGPNDKAVALKQLPDSSFIGIITTTSTNLLRFDKEGNLTSNKKLLDENLNFLTSMELLSDGGLILTWRDINKAIIMRLDSVGNEIWKKEYGSPLFSEYYMTEIVKATNGNFYAAGIIAKTYDPSGKGDLYIIKTDTLGNSWTNYIQGNIFYDSSVDCSKDSLELPLEGWIVSAKTDSTIFYGVTDAQGNYEIRTDIGDYIVHAHIPNAYWIDTLCGNDTLISMPTNFDTVIVDYPIQAQYECPIINVDVSTPYLRRCFSNIYYVSYCNEGTVPEENAYIEVQFDEWMTIDSSSISGIQSSVDSQLYIFDIGNIGVGECGGFQVFITLECDSTTLEPLLGQTHCVTAHSYPDSICLPPNTNWDGSTISVEGECLGDSIRFTIENIGTNPMSESKSYIVIEDIVIHLNGTFQLGPSESIDVQFPIDTAHTYRMEAEQSSNHPTSTAPSVTIEGCGTVNPLSLGFVNQYSEDDADPFISMDCQENRGSYDPNDKRGFPSGIGDDHIIFDHTELEYHIRFQNTGTDTAFLVVIRDTLSPFLDPTTVRPGASSHPYTWTLQNNGAMKFTFENIMLPDSNINEAASHGFVKFKIAQREGNEPNTIINNQASIYFDFNAPIITNQTTHKILEPMMHLGTDTLYFCNDTTYTQDTTIITKSPQLSWNVETTISIILSSPTIDSIFYTIDTTSNLSDTMWIEYLTSIEGCDSIVIFNVNYRVNNIDLENPISNIQFFPNPVQHQGSLTMELKEAMEFSFTLRNSLGQEVGQKKFSQKLMAGKNTVPIRFSGLSPGFYWLDVMSAKGGMLVKVVVR